MAATINPEVPVAHPQKCTSGGTRRTATKRPRTIVQCAGTRPSLRDLLADAVRGMGRTVRGVATAGDWERKDVIRRRIHAASILERLILSAHDAGAPIEDVLPVAAAVERFVRQVYGETSGPALLDAFTAETEAQARADVAQLRVVAGGGPGALADAQEKLHAHRVAVDRAWLAVTSCLALLR